MNINAKLLKKCSKGDSKAQFQLYKSCFSLLMGVCIRYKKDEAEARAILNQGFFKILKNIGKYNPKVPFEAWIRRIMINTIIDEYRKNKKEKELIEYSNFEQVEIYKEHVDYNNADKAFDVEEIEGMIKELPPISQKVFNLYIIDGYTHKEIGKLLEISIGTSKWHLSFARKRLQERIKATINSKMV